MHTVLPSEVFVFDAVGLVVVRTGSSRAFASRDVTLHGNGHRVRATPVGAGCHRGRVTILLRPHGEFARALPSLVRMLEAERIEVHAGGAPAVASPGRRTHTTMNPFVMDASAGAS